MKREYKVYEKGGYTYVHYNGFPEGVKIGKDENFYNYPWGWMTINKKSNVYDLHDEDHDMLYKQLWNGVVVEKNGKYGVVDSLGEEVFPCVFDQIEKLKESVFGRLGNSYWELRKSGSSTIRGRYENTGFFVKNGKKGWQEKGQIVIPAYYDDVKGNDESNFYLVLKDGVWSYINRKGEPVLTNVREIEGANNPVPFPFHTGKKDLLVLQEYVGHEEVNDSNVVLMDGVWQRLDRISGDEICKMMVDPTDEKPLTMKDMELFNNDFSYEYTAYQVMSQEAKGVIDCLQKLQSMGLHSNTWHYIVKVWKTVGENPSSEELRYLRYQIEENGQLGELKFAFGHDSTLKNDQTKMFVVTHYNERCWPAMWEMDWWEERSVLSLSQIKRKLTKLRKTIDKEVLEPYKEEVWQDQLWGGIYGMEYNKSRSWAETLKVLNYFKKKGSPIVDGIRKEAESIDWTLEVKPHFSRRKCAFHYKKLKWLLENGADVNAHYANYTGLDYLVGNYKHIWKDDFSESDKAFIDDMRHKCIQLLLDYGAKTLQQVREGESENEDYKVELQRM